MYVCMYVYMTLGMHVSVYACILLLQYLNSLYNRWFKKIFGHKIGGSKQPFIVGNSSKKINPLNRS